MLVEPKTTVGFDHEIRHRLKSPDVVYDLKPDSALDFQADHETAARSYPRRLPLAIERADGAWVRDTRGQLFLDCLAAAGSLPLGYNHPELNAEIIRHAITGAQLPADTGESPHIAEAHAGIGQRLRLEARRLAPGISGGALKFEIQGRLRGELIRPAHRQTVEDQQARAGRLLRRAAAGADLVHEPP